MNEPCTSSRAACACGRVHSETDPRGLIVAALHQQADEDFDWSDAEQFADALLPVVRSIAADELRDAANCGRSEVLIRELLDRADALDSGQ